MVTNNSKLFISIMKQIIHKCMFTKLYEKVLEKYYEFFCIFTKLYEKVLEKY